MWWRAILTTVAFTCTFSENAQAHDQNHIKDIVCVLLLNGLQKEDLDVGILKKLQRHNVNIDNMNNETLHKECTMVHEDSSEKITKEEIPVTIKTVSSDITDKNEDQKIKLSESSLQNIIINYFNNVHKSNTNDGEKVEKDNTEKNADKQTIENFVNVWNALSKTKEKYDVTNTTIGIETSTAGIQRINEPYIHTSENKSMEYINRVLLNFIASQQILTTTSRPTTKKVDYDFIAQKLKEIIADTNKNMQSPSTINKQMAINHDSNQDLDIVKLTNQLKMFGPLKDQMNNNRNIRIEDQNMQYQTERRYLVDDVIPLTFMAKAPNEKSQYLKQEINMDKQIQVLSEDIIRGLAESVKTKVLQDLKIVITTTTEKPTTVKHTTVKTTTTRKTTERTSMNINHDQTQEKDATKVLEKFMEMFQQYKANGETTILPVTKARNYRGKNIRSENNTPANLPYPYNAPHNITAIIINPYNPHAHSAIQTLPNQPYTLLNINPQDAKSVTKITQLNIFNSKNHFHPPPITIQTNSVEVPPLGMPAPDSVKVVYQNIVVSTKQPFEKTSYQIEKLSQPYKNFAIPFHKTSDNRHRSHTVYDYDEIKKDEARNIPSYPSQRDRGNYNYEMGRLDRDREYNNVYKERRKPIKYEDYGRSHYSDHNIERFHEKLERVDDWPTISRERDIDEYRSPKLVSRHQRPLNEAKKRSRYDDSHFKNFLKTQQKVNDMLERILATKSVDRPRSVETTVNFK